MYNASLSSKIKAEEIQKLPQIKFSGKIHLVEGQESTEQALHHLQQQKVLGFDTETRPVFRKYQPPHPVALLQLASASDAFLFRLHQKQNYEAIVSILERSDILKVGIGVFKDVRALTRSFEFQPDGFFDFAVLCQSLKIQQSSLRNLSAILFQKRLSKNAQLSNWERNPLTSKQILYAATDAWISREIFLKLSKQAPQIPELLYEILD